MTFGGKKDRLLTTALGFALLFALVASAFLHKPFPPKITPAQIELAAYALPDGTIPYLCSGQGGPLDHNGNVTSPCPFCTLCKYFALPPRELVRSVSFLITSVDYVFAREAMPWWYVRVAFRSRAPPLFA